MIAKNPTPMPPSTFFADLIEKNRDQAAEIDRLKAELAKVTAERDGFKLIIECLSDNEISSYFWNPGCLLNCNDAFCWACADCEPLNVEDIPALNQACEDCKAVGEYSEGPLLFIARKRKERPQGAYYACIKKEAWPLFDACGDARPSQPGNPVGSDQIEAYVEKKRAASPQTARDLG